MRLDLTLLALTGLAVSSAANAEAPAAIACSPEAAAAAGAAVRTALARLMAIPLYEMETSVPPPVRDLIERTKDRLRAFVQAEMACAPPSPDPEALAAAMAARGDAYIDRTPPDPDNPAPGRHGHYLAYQVSPVEGRPELLAVVATLGISCGTDSMLLLYQREGGRWRELMVRRAEPYAEVKGGWGDLRFAVSPRDARGRWFVATVSVTPWCTSAWQGLPYALARPGPTPDRPDVFLRGKETIYLGNEEDMLLRAEPDAFELRYVAASIDPAVHNRRHVRRYAVRGDSVRRIQPVAESVRDFVDEWVVSPWAEARHWSGPDATLEPIHAQLHEGRYELLDEFASIRACGNGVTQVEMTAEQGPGWYFFASGGASGPWILERVGRRAEAACAGPDRLEREPG
mgnify:CR=1 FL=1